MTKLKLNDTLLTGIIKLSDGNPGAAVALCDICKVAEEIDTFLSKPKLSGMPYLLLIDSLNIYGTDIYVLYSDICEKNAAKTMAVLRATRLNILEISKLKEACSRQDYSGKDLIPVDEIFEQVKEKYKWI